MAGVLMANKSMNHDFLYHNNTIARHEVQEGAQRITLLAKITLMDIIC
jgi:hypothetical protein